MQYTCHFCFEPFTLTIYPEDGEEQEFVTDCEVCCHPLLIQASWVEEEGRFSVDVSPG
jgi:hypothetical protein